MNYFQVDVGQVDKPVGLLMIKGLGGAEIGEVFVVGEDLYGEQGSVEVVLPGFQGPDDSKEFSVINVIVSFCWRGQLGKVGAGVLIAIRVSLEEDHARGVFGGISCNGKGGSEVWEVEYRF